MNADIPVVIDKHECLPETSSHGNAKHVNGKYVRSQLDVSANIREQVGAKATVQNVHDMLLDSSNVCPRNI